MLTFSITNEYSVDIETLKNNYPAEYESFIDRVGYEDDSEFLLHLIYLYGPEEIGADEEYGEVRVY